MADVDYLKYAQLMGQGNPIAEGTNQLGQTIDDNRKFDMQKQNMLRQNRLADLQIQQGELGMTDALAKQQGHIEASGGGTLKDFYANQARAAQLKAQQARSLELGKYTNDVFSKISTAVKDNTLTPAVANNHFKAAMKQAGIDMDKYGTTVEFKNDGGYYSGPIKKNDLISVNGQITPYGGDGIVESARIIDFHPETHQPIYGMGKDTKFKEPHAERDGYKFRSRKSGDQFIEEESQDGGATWKVLSKAPRYKDKEDDGSSSSGQGKGTQMFWTQSNPDAPPIMEEVPIGSPAYKRYMGGDLQATGRVKPFGKKGQMTSGQAQSSFKYAPNDRVSTMDETGAKVTTTVPKGGRVSTPTTVDPAIAQKLVQKYGNAQAAREAYAKGER